MENFIKELFRDVIANKYYDETLINRYFSEDYVQIVDNQDLDFAAFKKHIQKLKEKVVSVEVVFFNIISNEKTVFTKHLVKSTLVSGDIVKHKVFAEFQITDGKVTQCDELTLLIAGNKNERNLGALV